MEPSPDRDEEIDEIFGSPIHHSQTAPVVGRDYADNSGNTISSKDAEKIERLQCSGDTVIPTDPTADGGIRHRKHTTTFLSDEEEEEKPKKRYRFFKNVQPKEPFTVANQIQRTVLVAPINILLVSVPVGIALNFTIGPSSATFAVNFVALIPLYFITEVATDEIEKRLGPVLSNFFSITTRLVSYLSVPWLQ